MKEIELYRLGLFDDWVRVIRDRAERFSVWLQARPEETVIVFGHGGIFAHLLCMSMNNCEVLDTQWPPPYMPPPTTFGSGVASIEGDPFTKV